MIEYEKNNEEHKDKEVRKLSKRRIHRYLKNIEINFISKATNKKCLIGKIFVIEFFILNETV